MPFRVSDWAAIAFLSLFGLFAASIPFYLLFRKGRYSLEERLLYAPVYMLSRVLWRVEVIWHASWLEEGCEAHGKSPIEDCSKPLGSQSALMIRDRIKSGAVLIANHRSSVDPFFVQLAAGDRVHWMVAAEYFRHFLFGPLLRSYQAIPTHRGGMDNAATKRAIKLAANGEFVGLFPEGRINRTHQPLLTIRPGAAMVAARSQVPLIPLWILDAPSGKEVYSALFIPAHVKVVVGPPCQPPNDPIAGEGDDSTQPSSRHQNNQWICQAMQQAMILAEIEPQGVKLAGRNWLGS